jgi:hypothetical protein
MLVLRKLWQPVQDFIPQLIDKYQVDKGYRSLFVQPLLDLMTYFIFNPQSGRELELSIKYDSSLNSILPFDNINRTNIVSALENRLDLFRELYYITLKVANQNLPSNLKTELPPDFRIFDSTHIPVSFKLFPWAKYQKNKQVSNIQISFVSQASQSSLGQLIFTTPQNGEKPLIYGLIIEPNTTYIMDAGFRCFAFYQKLSQTADFISRIQEGTSFKFICNSDFPIIDTDHIISDKIILLGSNVSFDNSDRIYRLLKVKVDIKERKFITHYYHKFKKHPKHGFIYIITTRFDLSPELIAYYYFCRWFIEILIRWLKRYLAIKHFIGTSPEAVFSQLYIAFTIYLLILLSARTSIDNEEIYLREPYLIIQKNLLKDYRFLPSYSKKLLPGFSELKPIPNYKVGDAFACNNLIP